MKNIAPPELRSKKNWAMLQTEAVIDETSPPQEQDTDKSYNYFRNQTKDGVTRTPQSFWRLFLEAAWRVLLKNKYRNNQQTWLVLTAFLTFSSHLIYNKRKKKINKFKIIIQEKDNETGLSLRMAALVCYMDGTLLLSLTYE